MPVVLRDDFPRHVGDQFGRAVVVIGAGLRIGAEGSILGERIRLLMTTVCRDQCVSQGKGGFAVGFGDRALKSYGWVEGSVQTAATEEQEASLPLNRHADLEFVSVVFAVRALVLVDLTMHEAMSGQRCYHYGRIEAATDRERLTCGDFDRLGDGGVLDLHLNQIGTACGSRRRSPAPSRTHQNNEAEEPLSRVEHSHPNFSKNSTEKHSADARLQSR